eukprot:697834-Prorocentrum_minimum.AAC.2
MRQAGIYLSLALVQFKWHFLVLHLQHAPLRFLQRGGQPGGQPGGQRGGAGGASRPAPPPRAASPPAERGYGVRKELVGKLSCRVVRWINKVSTVNSTVSVRRDHYCREEPRHANGPPQAR